MNNAQKRLRRLREAMRLAQRANERVLIQLTDDIDKAESEIDGLVAFLSSELTHNLSRDLTLMAISALKGRIEQLKTKVSQVRHEIDAGTKKIDSIDTRLKRLSSLEERRELELLLSEHLACMATQGLNKRCV